MFYVRLLHCAPVLHTYPCDKNQQNAALPERASETTMLGSTANDSLAMGEKMELVRQLCKEQFNLIMEPENLHSLV